MELDDDWINKFEEIDKKYEDFYKNDLYYVNLRVIYINRENEIEHLKQESFLMSKPNFISYEEIIQMLKSNSCNKNKKYSLLSILKYNIILEHEDIKFMDDNKCDYLSVIKNIDSIHYDKSINMFHDLNDLIFVFYEKSRENIGNNNNNNHNSTKKIYLNSSNKKTIKKQYKD
jgi:hypothetical protein